MTNNSNSNNSNFAKIVEFHKQFGLPHYETSQIESLQNEKLLKFRTDLIEEEFGELKEAINQKDFVEIADALGDILYVTYGFCSSLGINADQIYNLIHESNMSKLCVSEEEAQNTVNWYKEQYEQNLQPYDTPAYRISENGKYYVVYNQSSGKILKSINYNAVDLQYLIK
jgi:predicted HAD superfamily Cof-like phosphohydrolase